MVCKQQVIYCQTTGVCAHNDIYMSANTCLRGICGDMLQEGLKGRGISMKTIFEVISIAVDSDLEVVYQRLLLRGDKKIG